MVKIRLFYKKHGRTRYISHLDMNRCMMRALKRSRLPVWYTEGFNPHMYLTFPLPLSLGYESDYECVDMKLTEEVPFEEILTRVNACLPEGLTAFAVNNQEMDQKEIAWADYDIRLSCQPGQEEAMKEAFLAFVASPEILVEKKTKKGTKEVDVKPLFSLLSAETQPGCLALCMRFATGITVNINPSLLLDAFASPVPVEGTWVNRTMVYTSQLEQFR